MSRFKTNDIVFFTGGMGERVQATVLAADSAKLFVRRHDTNATTLVAIDHVTSNAPSSPLNVSNDFADIFRSIVG